MSAPASIEKRLFDVAGAVEYFKSVGATAATANFVRGLISSGALPHLRIGRKFYVSRGAIDAWLASRERRSRQ